MKMIGFQRRYVALTYLGFPFTSPTLGSCVPSFFTCWLRGSRSLKELSESTFTGDCTWPTSLSPVQVAFRWLLQICPSDLFSYIATRESFFFFPPLIQIRPTSNPPVAPTVGIQPPALNLASSSALCPLLTPPPPPGLSKLTLLQQAWPACTYSLFCLRVLEHAVLFDPLSLSRVFLGTGYSCYRAPP